MSLIDWVIIALGTAAIVVTLLPLLRSKHPWIRLWDFPRIQIAAILVVAVGAAVAALDRGPWTIVFIAALAAALVWQLVLIRPYTPLARLDVRQATAHDPDAELQLLVANVHMSNREVGRLLELVGRVDPDLVLLVETDDWWHDALAPLRDRYPHRLAEPRQDGYGMHLFSRLELVHPQLRFLVDRHVPSIRTGVRLRSGEVVRLYGVHPPPPPMQSTDMRDAELLLVARDVAAADEPAIVAGDLNDVAWSRTTRLFRKISRLLDPRIGRGPYATFSANWPLLRWALDHVFVHETLTLKEMRVEPSIGSDHFPFHVWVCHTPQAAAVQEAPQASAGDQAEAAAVTGRRG